MMSFCEETMTKLSVITGTLRWLPGLGKDLQYALFPEWPFPAIRVYQ